MNNLLFVTGCFPKEMQQYYLNNSINAYSLASNVLSWRLIEGFDALDDLNLTIFSCPFVPFYPKDYKHPILRSYSWDHKNHGEAYDKVIGCLNVKYFGLFHKSIRLKKNIIEWIENSASNRNILFYSNNFSFMRIIIDLKRRYPDLVITVLITDLNEFDNDPVKPRTIKAHIKQLMFNYRIHTMYKNMDYADSFILLADKMRNYIRIGNRPYLICEGICNANIPYTPLINHESVNIVYSGNINKRYGILNIIEAVHELGEKFQLTICGDGDTRRIIEHLSQEYLNVHYLGMLSNERVIEEQQKADLLINSMPNFGRHTELSFPSKLMEYMIQGRPVMCHKVGGIPDEYDDYLLYFKDSSIQGIKSSLIEFSKLSYEEKSNISSKNRGFMLSCKNQYIQAKRIIQFIFG